METFGNKHGFTLPLTIVILAIIGILSFSLYDMVKRERIESYRRFKDAQSTLELESAANYAFYRMNAEKKPWRTDSLNHTSKDGHIQFSLSHKQDGAFAKIQAWNSDSSKVFTARTGFIPGPRPALVLTAPQTSIALVGDARIEGGTAIKNGSISYSTNYKMMATKNSFYDTVYVADTLSYFDTLQYYPELSRKEFSKTYTEDRCVFDGTDIIQGDISCKTVITQGDSRCENCRIQAERIFVRGRTILNNVCIIAKNISLKDSAIVAGVFFAQDTLEVKLDLQQNKKINLIVQGEKKNDVEYSGKIDIQKLTANDATIIFYGDNWDETLKGIPVEISEQVDIHGAVIINGTLDFRGKLTGQMTTSNFAFYEGKTLWRGFLRGGQIKRDTTYHPFLPDVVHFGGVASYEK